MKTTLNLPDELIRAIKIRAAQENRKLQDLIAELLRRGLAQVAGEPAVAARRVQFPLVDCAPAARPEEEMTPERLAQILIEDEARWHLATDREPLR